MRTTIDKAGRLVIPRQLLEQIGLPRGGEAEVELDGASLRIDPVAGSRLREEGGLLFIPSAGEVVTSVEIRGLIDADRHARCT